MATIITSQAVVDAFSSVINPINAMLSQPPLEVPEGYEGVVTLDIDDEALVRRTCALGRITAALITAIRAEAVNLR